MVAAATTTTNKNATPMISTSCYNNTSTNTHHATVEYIHGTTVNGKKFYVILKYHPLCLCNACMEKTFSREHHWEFKFK